MLCARWPSGSQNDRTSDFIVQGVTPSVSAMTLFPAIIPEGIATTMTRVSCVRTSRSGLPRTPLSVRCVVCVCVCVCVCVLDTYADGYVSLRGLKAH